MKFSQITIGQEFEIGGRKAIKLDNRRYQFVEQKNYERSLRTSSGNANVNGLSGDKAHAAKQKSDRTRLNEIAQSTGYANWSALSRAALDGEEININEPPQSLSEGW